MKNNRCNKCGILIEPFYFGDKFCYRNIMMNCPICEKWMDKDTAKILIKEKNFKEGGGNI